MHLNSQNRVSSIFILKYKKIWNSKSHRFNTVTYLIGKDWLSHDRKEETQDSTMREQNTLDEVGIEDDEHGDQFNDILMDDYESLFNDPTSKPLLRIILSSCATRCCPYGVCKHKIRNRFFKKRLRFF